MLLTICPNCSAQFKVQPEQLNVRQGRVMCGRCRQVFNAFQSLSRAKDTEEEVAIAPPETTQPPPRDQEILTPFSANDVFGNAGADRFFFPEEPVPLPAAFTASEVLPRKLPEPTSARGIFDGKATLYNSPKAITENAAPVSSPSERVDNVAAPGIDLSSEQNPLLAEAATNVTAPPVAKSGLWIFGALVLFISLAAQAAYSFRSALVSNYPALRPIASNFCDFAGCVVSWGRDETTLKIEASELIEAPSKPGRILLTAILVNRGKVRQDLPSLELRLTDSGNQVVVSRLLHPADYLGRAIVKSESLAPNTELYVNVDLKLEPSSKPPASGYGLIVFYP